MENSEKIEKKTLKTLRLEKNIWQTPDRTGINFPFLKGKRIQYLIQFLTHFYL